MEATVSEVIPVEGRTAFECRELRYSRSDGRRRGITFTHPTRPQVSSAVIRAAEQDGAQDMQTIKELMSQITTED